MRLFAVVDLKLYGVAVDLFDQLDRGQKEFVFGYIGISGLTGGGYDGLRWD